MIQLTNYYFEYKSPIGILIITSNGDSITRLGIKGQKYFDNALDGAIINNGLPIFSDVIRWLDIYFRGEKPTFTPKLAPEGSLFRQKVWNILIGIPYGEVITYGYIAKLIAKCDGKDRMSAQAVGGAVGHNPISIIIPCHRVIGTNGNLTGFASGLDTKITLLGLENIDISKFHKPSI